MQQNIGVLLMLVICSLIPSSIWIAVNKDEKTIANRFKEQAVKVIAFFFSINYFLMSAMKLYLGYKTENLIESFWNIQGRTYFNYGLMLAVIGVVIPICMRFIFKSAAWKIIKFFDSTMFVTLFFTFFFVRKINNTVYCTVFTLAFIITLVSLWKILKKDVIAVGEREWKKSMLNLLPVIIYWIVTVVIYIPNELYLSNPDDFPMSYWYFFGKLLIGSLIILLITLVGGRVFLLEKHVPVLSTLLFSFLTIGYLQGMLLNGDMTQLDGTVQTWTMQKRIINLVIWLGLLAAICVLRYWKKEKADKIIRLVSVYLVLIQVVSLGIVILTSDAKSTKKEVALTTEGVLEIGEKNNVVVFVLDKFDGTIMDEILAVDSDFLEPLHDFTYYENATSAYAPTGLGLPFLLTGTEWVEGMSMGEWFDYAYEGDTLLSALAEQNYDISLYTITSMVSESVMDIVSNYKDGVERTCSLQDTLDLMMQCSKYRMAPFILKEYYQYDSSDIALLVDDGTVWTAENDYPFYKSLVEQGLQVVDNEDANGTFKFIHMHGAHPPYILTEDFQYVPYDARRSEGYGTDKLSQARGAMGIVYEYIRQMKELGKYEDATIIITADHGYTEWLCDDEGNVIKTSFPIIFIKEPEESREEIKVSQAPVSHADIIPTILENIGFEVKEKTCSEIEETEQRSRKFIRRGTGADSAAFEINGDVRDLNSWKYLYSTSEKE